MGDFEEALKCYFKVEYLDPNNPKCNRPIAWCSFVLGKFDQAEKYYLKLLLQGESKVDLMNLGHVMWCKKQRKEALSYYQQSISSRHYSMAEFLAVFDEDLTYLKGHGVDTADVPLMLDQIRYSIGEQENALFRLLCNRYFMRGVTSQFIITIIRNMIKPSNAIISKTSTIE